MPSKNVIKLIFNWGRTAYTDIRENLDFAMKSKGIADSTVS
jgi:hypothetical protein